MLRPLDTEELRKAVKPAPSKKFVVSKPPVIWLAMQTHSLARIADSTVWLTLQTQWSDSKCRLNSLTHDADSTVWQRSNCRNATQQGGSLAQNGGLPCCCSPETFNSGLVIDPIVRLPASHLEVTSPQIIVCTRNRSVVALTKIEAAMFKDFTLVDQNRLDVIPPSNDWPNQRS